MDLAVVTAELARRAGWRAAIRSELFARQLAVHDDPAQFRAVHPGRRSGKSEYIPRGALLSVFDAGFNEVVLIGAESQKKANALHWANLKAIMVRHGIDWRWDGQLNAFVTPWGAYLMFWGFSDKDAVELLRGFKVRAAYFDEVATYSALLKRLVFEVMEPCLGDTGGTLTLCGTPTVTRAGTWFQICCEKLGEFSVHHWTVLENPKFPRDAKEMLAGILRKNKWTEENATYQREWMGRFVNDLEATVYKYLESRNAITARPKHYDPKVWHHAIGSDYGITDHCAWVVWGWHPHERDLYGLFARKDTGLLTDQAADITAELCRTYRPERLVGDSGGLGKPYVEEWNRRHAGKDGMIPMEAADKQQKNAHIRLFNTDMRAGRVRLVLPDCDQYASELAVLPFADPQAPEHLLKEHPGHQNHCCDAGLYGYTAIYAYLNEAPEPRLADRDPDDAAKWLEQREAEELQRELSRPDWERF